MQNSRELEGAYAEWIGRWSWTWFVTLTFRGWASRARAEKRFQQWIAAVQREIGGDDFRWIRVLERGLAGDNIHFHVLIGGITSKKRQRWRDLWEELAGDAHIQMFDENKNGIRYMLKTLAADGSLDIEFHLPTV